MEIRYLDMIQELYKQMLKCVNLLKRCGLKNVIIVRKTYSLTAERVRRIRFQHLKRINNVDDDDTEQMRDALIRKKMDDEMFS
ncbi:MAG: hypothetical protein EZS28_004825 [Streblomastix strix]|uniref:Uncharacterized protein n=1 Tax=Streblomastix strix TaxID=222440 RepID=A0A5J4WXW2_9EUKA|nr:MAG: hypothetical protein EZS28_004825 [Streblomastix strix]